MSANPRFESTSRRWMRRAITIPGTFAAAAVWSLLLVPCLVAAALSDTVMRLRGRPSGYARALLAVTAVFVAECVGLVALGAAWLLAAGRPRPLEHWTFRIQLAWAGFLFASLRTIYRMSVELEGADEVKAAPFVVFARHTSIFDTLVPIVTISVPFGTRLRYVMKRELLWDPCLDVAGNRLVNRFVARGSSNPETQIRLVAELGAQLPPDAAVVIYPEGTRYTAAKHAQAIERLEKTRPGLVELGRAMQRVLPPRPGGPLALLEQRHDVVFMAHSGFDGITGWRDVWRGDLIGRRIRVRYTRYPAATIPADKEARALWLFERWLELDAWVRSVESTHDAS